MLFPGWLGVGLYRLRGWIMRQPMAAVGPLLGLVAADSALDLRQGRLNGVIIELGLSAVIAVLVGVIAQQKQPGMAGLLMFVLGAVSALGSSMLLALALAHGSGPLTIVGLRHLAVACYTWASIAEEPPPRRRVALQPVRA